jgi:hypothetical protein
MMGLDMYAYVGQPGQWQDYYEYDDQNSRPVKPRELSYWRKHPSLHGWMERLWIQKGKPIHQAVQNHYNDGTEIVFNGIELLLTWQDIDDLERAVRGKKLPHTVGFFFGSTSDEEYYEHDLKFCKDAKAEIFLGLPVCYNSSW